MSFANRRLPPKRGSIKIDMMIGRMVRCYQPKKEEKERPRSGGDDSTENGMQADDGVSEMYKEYDLYLAAKNGHLHEFKRIVDRVSTADSLDLLSRLSPTGNTFIHVAAKHGNQDIVDFVARKNPSLLLAMNFNGETALHLLAKAGDESTVKALLQIHRDLLLSASVSGR